MPVWPYEQVVSNRRSGGRACPTIGAQSAHGAVIHRAKVWYYDQPHTYDEARKTLTLNYRRYSNNKRCIDKYSISDVDLVLYFQPDPEYATGDGPFTNLVRSQGTFTLKRVGLGHYSISLPGAQNVATVNPGGSYGGTYSLETWWRALIGPNRSLVGRLRRITHLGRHGPSLQRQQEPRRWPGQADHLLQVEAREEDHAQGPVRAPLPEGRRRGHPLRSVVPLSYPRQDANAVLVQPPPEPAGAGPSARPP